MKRLVLLALSMGLTACSHSPPTHFYTLSTVAAHQSVSATGGSPVVVGDVMLPATLDQQSIVLRNCPNALDVSDQDRWAAPLQGMTRRVLADDLRQRLGEERVLPPGDPMPQGTVETVILNIQDFAGSRDGTVVLDVDWSVQDRHQKVLMQHHSHLTREVDGRDAGAIVAAQSDMLGALSDDIARGLSRAASG